MYVRTHHALPVPQRHLPTEMKWPVFKAGTGKIVMSHTNRNLTTAELAALDKAGRRTPDPRFRTVSQALMSFDEFVEATAEHARACKRGDSTSEPPYFGTLRGARSADTHVYFHCAHQRGTHTSAFE